jgi:hypothetical protein
MKDAKSVKPIKLQEYVCKQSKHDVVPKLPLRGMLLAQSGSGKTGELVNLLVNVYCAGPGHDLKRLPSVDGQRHLVEVLGQMILWVKAWEWPLNSPTPFPRGGLAGGHFPKGPLVDGQRHLVEVPGQWIPGGYLRAPTLC